MNEPGILQYKCRRCGVIFNGGLHTPTLDTTLISLMVQGTHYVPCAMVSETTLHNCETDERGVGIADCVGGRYDATPPAEEATP